MDVCLEADRRVTVGVNARAGLDAPMCASCREKASSLAVGTLPTEGETSLPHPDRDLPPPTRFGRYVFAGEIGAGGMGVVYAAHDPELDRMVAVKLLRGDGDARLQERLRRESQVMARLAHPNVVGVYDVGVFEDRVFIAMEYVDGETLAQWSAKPRSQREILEAYCAAARGLAAAHAAGIVHRDFKPDNVLIGNDGRVRVGDFGLARPAGIAGARPSARGRQSGPAGSPAPGSTARGLTAPGTLVGTRYYMAPELYKGVEADVRSDQFSFCVALFTALYGERPIDRDTPDARGTSPCTLRPRGPRLGSRVARRVCSALRRGLAADPAARFASLDELLAELESSPQRRLRWALAVGAALAVIAIRLGQPPALAAECESPALTPAPVWSSHERADGGKPAAAALLDPAAPHEPAPRSDRALCAEPPGALVSR